MAANNNNLGSENADTTQIIAERLRAILQAL